jgi:hypothetical protein
VTFGISKVTVAFLALLAVAAGTATATASTGSSLNLRITPATGTPTTRFAVSFTVPARSGHIGFLQRTYEVSASAVDQTQGCDGTALVGVPDTRAHARVTVLLSPIHGWCAGSFRGRVLEIEGPWCPPGAKACPKFASRVRAIGRFGFSVRAVRDITPPTFAGLVSAVACTPGAQRPGETTPFTLTWKPATDNVTPPSQIVYLVFLSTTPGGENFTQATWTTRPGVTSFRTPGLPSHGTFYFVVRARDRAGNVDRNMVERRGVDPCL